MFLSTGVLVVLLRSLVILYIKVLLKCTGGSKWPSVIRGLELFLPGRVLRQDMLVLTIPCRQFLRRAASQGKHGNASAFPYGHSSATDSAFPVPPCCISPERMYISRNSSFLHFFQHISEILQGRKHAAVLFP